jgi:hypothetical protein
VAMKKQVISYRKVKIQPSRFKVVKPFEWVQLVLLAGLEILHFKRIRGIRVILKPLRTLPSL